MAKGNRIINVRLSPETLIMIETEIAAREAGSRRDLLTVSDFIRSAIREKCEHAERGRRCKIHRNGSVPREMAVARLNAGGKGLAVDDPPQADSKGG